MTEAQFVEVLQQVIWLILLLSAPVLLTSMGVGLIISIFQAVTQIQESTLTFVPKILASLLVFVLAAPWLVQTISDYTRGILQQIIEMAR